MAPLRQINKILPENNPAAGIKTRSHLTIKKDSLPKRKAEESPIKKAAVKRCALADIKNHEYSKENPIDGVSIKTVVNKKTSLAVPTNKKPLATLNVRKTTSFIQQQTTKTENVKPLLGPVAVKVTESKLPKPRMIKKVVISKKTETIKTTSSTTTTITNGVVTRTASRNSELEKSESSLYLSALEDLNLDEKKNLRRREVKKSRPPPGINDYDQEQSEDLGSVAMYAFDIFKYLKSREGKFVIDDYMKRQTSISRAMRALLVDWMVEIQENFELNHETLYLAVKMLDLFLCKVNIKKENLQLVACTSLFVASKYDERIPPLIEDFLYVCDHLYDANDILVMEQKILKSLDFQLGIPLSYRFLRRYARCAKIELPLLTLARFILEYSLMDYAMITYSDSKIAAASLYLALIMKDQEKGAWTPTLEYYSGYKLEEFKDIVLALNACLHKKQQSGVKTIRNKYSHKVFFEVAKIPLIDDLEL